MINFAIALVVAILATALACFSVLAFLAALTVGLLAMIIIDPSNFAQKGN